MSRMTLRILGLALVVAACGAAGASDSAAPPATSAPAVSATAPATRSGPVAPDFTLTLGEGGTYTLSEGTKPVYMVFWAEW